MIIAMNPYGSEALNLPQYEFEGTAPEFLKDNNGNWEIVFKTGCTITFNTLETDVDVFLVGGGARGGSTQGNPNNGYALGGNGGKGGGVVNGTLTLETGVDYPVVIGGSDQATKAFGLTAAPGAGSNGGTGACTSPAGNATAGIDGVLAFNNTGGTLYENGTPIKFGAGGGGGAAVGTGATYASAAGGATGGGHGGSGNPNEAESILAGVANTGCGGGGAGRYYNSGTGGAQSPGYGGSGIVIIRNARSNQ